MEISAVSPPALLLPRRAFARFSTMLVAGRAFTGSAYATQVSLPVGATDRDHAPGAFDVEGRFPRLAFRMERVSDNKTVTAQMYRGDVVIIYFGFTRCSDTCPLTALNAARLFSRLGADARKVRFLFVTVDLDYDKPKRLKHYLAQFGPPPYIDGLYGTPAELNAFVKRYSVYFKVPAGPNTPDPTSAIQHSGAVYLFSPKGEAIAIINNFGSGHPNLEALAKKIKKLL